MEQTDNTRRQFMLALGLGGASAAAALLAGKPVAAAEPVTAPAEAPQASQGYQLSGHVQTYYRTARI